jgi:subtilisin family serine protease
MRRAFTFALLGLVSAALMPAQAPKQKITRAADVPEFSYSVSGKVEDLLHSDEAFASLTAQMRHNVSFFKANHIRIVNMSWGGSVKDYEDGLERCGIGKSVDERKQTARELFDIEKRGLEKAFASAPEILFVAAGGNANNDATFNEFIPSSIQLPNLITAGAVDKAGDEAPFTSYGSTVVVHSNGYEVDSYVPGGERMKFSGTSMASPNVVNLAAKILATCPDLKPPNVISLIRDTADGRRHLINPVKAVAAAQASGAAVSSR